MNLPSTRSLRLGVAAFLVVWALTTLISASSYYLDGAAGPASWLTTVGQFGSVWILWGAVVPVILWLARRFPLDRGRWPVAFAVHVGASLLWTAVYFPASVVVLRLWYGQSPFAHVWAGLRSYPYQAFNEGFIYWVLTAVAYALWGLLDRREVERRTAALAVQNAEIQEELARSELRTLRSQLHPHFLFSALNSVAGLIRTDDRRALRVLSRLSDLLRYALESEHEPFVRVATELEFVRQYLEIQQVRFRDRLETAVEVEPGTEDLAIPSMLLQPLVENAVIHGVGGGSRKAAEGAPGRNGGPDRTAVRVAVAVREGKLEVVVTNDARAGAPRPAGFGIGLQNVRERLERIYGNDAGFELDRTDGLVVAKLSVPAEPIGARETLPQVEGASR
ncbi:MAG: histidine kinase [Candidatus Eisenbacteria bacterium]